MRKITKQAVQAFINAQPIKLDNTEVEIDRDGRVWMLLYGNPIAVCDREGVRISTSGWETRTTKERLNGLLDHFGKPRVHAQKGKLMQDGQPWTGMWKAIL